MNNKLRLLEVVPYYAPAWAFGGPPKVMSEEAHELTRRGHEVTVFTTDAYESGRRLPSGTIDMDGVLVHRFRNISNWAAFHKYRFQPRGMRRSLTSIDVDLVHISELRHELAILAWHACKVRDLPLVISAHGTLPQRGGWKGALRRHYDRLLVDPMIAGARALIAQTFHEAQAYCKAGADPDRVHVIPLGVDQAPFPNDEEYVDLGVPADARVVMFLGRIHALKGVNRLIAGFAKATASNDDVWLVIAGRDDGGGLAEAQALAHSLGIAHRVSFPGPIYGHKRYEAYRRAEIFAITPTHYEETSLASLEAASVGTPLLVSAQAEVPYLEQYNGGLTIGPDEDPSRALTELLKNSGEYSSAAERMINERHLWKQVGTQLEQLFLQSA